ncbi:MAG TPA: branched-chain amino acid ABC transporter ATP-binding protein/permease [Stellaceae bacterium]|nr:branched-chain amino acid ABC transporter ATP-binding protein/permease [Stellaceae bacterium]
MNAPRGVALLGAASLIIYAVGFASAYELRVLTFAGCQVLMVLGYQLIFGHAGALSLAQGAFFGLGAYVTAILGARYGAGFAASFPLSILLPVALAALIAVPVLRLASHYFALATLGLAQVVLLAFVNGGTWTGGALGIPGLPGVSIFGWTVARGLPLLSLVWAVVAFGAFLSGRMTNGITGLAFTMLRENPLAASAIGIDGARLRFSAFLLSAGYGGAAGALEAHTAGVVSPEALGFNQLVTCLAMTVIGGSTRVAGAFLGALLLTYLPERLRFLEGQALLAYGAALLAAVILAPEGLAGLLARLWAKLEPVVRKDQVRPSPLILPPLGTREPLLEVRALARRFGGIEAIAGVDLTLASGEILGLIGPNGSGKTTLANLVTGLTKPDRGVIRFQGRRIDDLGAFEIARLGIARTFQTSALPAEVMVLAAVAVARASEARVLGTAAVLHARDRGAHRRKLDAEAMGLLERLGAGAVALRPCGDLPPGLARRVEIARALALRPSLLILDEPAAGLAESEHTNLADTLRSLAAEGLALIVIEHNMPFLLGLAGRVLALDAGRVIATGTPAEIRRDPRVMASYLGSAAA